MRWVVRQYLRHIKKRTQKETLSVLNEKQQQSGYVLVFFNLYRAHIFTEPNVLRNFSVVFTILNKNVSYSADGVSLPLCVCPCKSAHNINSIYDLCAVHSNVLYIPFKAKNIEEIVMKHTHKKKTHLTTEQKKNLFNQKVKVNLCLRQAHMNGLHYSLCVGHQEHEEHTI